MKLYDILQSIRATSSKNAKEAILRENQNDVLLQLYLQATYDPQINFWVKKLPAAKPADDFNDFAIQDIVNAVENLAKRKYTGNNAKRYIQDMMEDMDPCAQDLFRWMLLKDVKAGFSESTILKVWPDLFFIPPYQRCSLPDEKILGRFAKMKKFAVQLKADGMYLSLLAEGGVYTAITRQGNAFPAEFAEMLAKDYVGADAAILGEVLVVREGRILSRKEGNGILNSILKGGDVPEDCSFRMQAWDYIPMYAFKEGKFDCPYESRLYELRCNIHQAAYIQVIETEIVESLQAAYVFYGKKLANGEEGAVIKSLSGIWKDGTSKDCVKLKLEVDVELEAVALIEGDPNGQHAETFGSIRFVSTDLKVVVDVSGYTLEERKDIHANWETLYRGKIATVKSNELISSRDKDTYSLFLPRHIEWRLDKVGADDLQRIKDQFEAAKVGVTNSKGV